MTLIASTAPSEPRLFAQLRDLGSPAKCNCVMFLFVGIIHVLMDYISTVLGLRYYELVTFTLLYAALGKVQLDIIYVYVIMRNVHFSII